MDLAGRLQQLEDMVREAKSMPLSSSVLINKDEVLEMLREMQEDLPDEIKQARWVVKDREELMAKARADGDRIIEQAREEQLRMARKEEIVARATAEAETALADAPPRRRRSAEQEAAIAALEEQRDLRIRRRDVQRTELASLQDGVSTATRTPLPDDGAATAAITDDVMEMVHNGGTEPARPDP